VRSPHLCVSAGILTRVIPGDHAIDQIFKVMWEQSQATFDEDFNFISYYNWTGGNGALSPAVPNGGNGEPKGYSGLVGTHHRPSDDISTFGKPPLITCFWSSMTHLSLSVPDPRKRDVERGAHQPG
jgi:hypothetical protein